MNPGKGSTALKRISLLLALPVIIAGCDILALLSSPIPTSNDPVIQSLLAGAPRLPMGFYDYFGQLKSPTEAQRMVIAAGLNPQTPDSFLRIGLVKITETLIADGRHRFFTQPLGDPTSVGQIFALGSNVTSIDPRVLDPVDPTTDPRGTRAFRRSFFSTLLFRPRVAETNLKIRLDAPLKIGTRVFPAGSEISTGLDIAAGDTSPVGLQSGGLSCAVCHASVDPTTGLMVTGAPNTDLNIGLFLALSPNSTSGFLRFNKSQVDPFDGRFAMTGRRIIDSSGQPVQLPDPAAFEIVMDDLMLTIPPGGFEAAADATTAETKIPDSFVFGEGGMGWDGGFLVGPFGGLASLSSAVHTFEVNFFGPSTLSKLVGNIDSEVYLGIVLQNAGDPKLRIPDDVVPSQWLRENVPDAERISIVELPGFPASSLFSLNGLIFSPKNEPFMYSVLALSAFQQSLTVPPNTSIENQINLHSGAVLRGAEVFRAASCNSCHTPPYFTNGEVVPNNIIKASPRRAKGRHIYEGRLIDVQIPSFDQWVPLPPNPNLLTIPPDPRTASNLTLPRGLDNPDGGYKVIGLLGTYLKAPYLHDGSIAATKESIRVADNGAYGIVDRSGIGIPGTTMAARRVDAANSLRVLLDRDLRAVLLENNRLQPTLQVNGVEGTGHEFFVDPGAGFTYRQQTDLIAYLMALDDNPGQ